MKSKITWISALVAFSLLVLNIVGSNNTGIASIAQDVNLGGPESNPHPLSIESLREGEYPGSNVIIEQTLESGSNYERYLASYKSDGLKIYGLLTIPNNNPPQQGFPAIIFNHGYISPSVYQTTEKYIAYQDAFARESYVTFKSDYRGHGNSEGVARGGYGANDYTIDVLNAVASIKELKDPSTVSGQLSIVNPEGIGMWGHSMGGHITLESMVVNKEIKAGVIWAGVVVSYENLLNLWGKNRPTPTPGGKPQRGRWRRTLADAHGDPVENPEFWAGLSANSFINDVSGPIQLHHGTADSSVPIEFSQILKTELIAAGKSVELYEYSGDDHNISSNLRLALNRSVEFFNTHLKQ